VEWQENELISFRMTSGPLKRDDQTWKLLEIPAGTRFTLTTDIEFTAGIFDRLARPLVTAMVGRNMEKVLKNLKAIAERR